MLTIDSDYFFNRFNYSCTILVQLLRKCMQETLLSSKSALCRHVQWSKSRHMHRLDATLL